MTPCTRVEIVVEEALAPRIELMLQDVGIAGFTRIGRASGRGDRGPRRGDDPTGTSTNCVFVVAVESEPLVHALVEAVRPILSQYGGVCLVSEAQLVKH